jgi:hypothetical protein
MTDQEAQSDFEDAAESIWVSVIGEADPDAGTTRQEAMMVAGPRIQRMLDDGDLKLNPADAIKSALLRVDEKHGKRADKLIEDTANGKLALFDVEKLLDTVVTLGKSRRKLWRHVNESDLYAMNELRYKNKVAADEAYKIWQSAYAIVRRVVSLHGTVEAAHAADAFGVLDLQFA